MTHSELIHISLILCFLGYIQFIILFLLRWLLFLLRLWHNRSCGTRCLELELAVSNFCSLLVRSCRIDLCASKHECHLHSLVLNRLERSSYIYAQLSELLHITIINKVDRFLLRAIKYNPHHRLPSPHWAIRLNMHFIDTDSLSLGYKGIKYVFTEVLTLDHNLLLLGVPCGVKGGQSVYPVGFFGDS